LDRAARGGRNCFFAGRKQWLRVHYRTIRLPYSGGRFLNSFKTEMAVVALRPLQPTSMEQNSDA
jgi:hypothetical protein